MRKEKCNCEYQMLITLAVGLIIGVVMGMAIYAFAYPVFQSANWAAWVQAIGSVGAIGGAIYIANFEKNQRRNERNEDLCNSAYSLIESINMIQGLVIKFYNLRVRKNSVDEDKSNYDQIFRSWSHTFKKVYLRQKQWGDHGLITSVMEVNIQLEKMLEVNKNSIDGSLDSQSIAYEMRFVFPLLLHSKDKIVDFALKRGRLKAGDEIIKDVDGLKDIKDDYYERGFETIRLASQTALENGQLSGNIEEPTWPVPAK